MLSGLAQAQDGAAGGSNELWLSTGFATYHFDSKKNLNDSNPGVGIEYHINDEMAVTAGRFYNSDRQHSRYAGLFYQPWTVGGVKLGAVLAAFDGYPYMRGGGWFPALIPAATWEYGRFGANLAVIPTYKERLHGGISLQLNFKMF
ncbi:hypothetical protein D3872_06505 [Massilia cavernae]|uniref:Sn-glycerol-3-phosphate transporter n=2 Tax=Massilia cavernae TaxID=2320864 RepID=A0A418Y5A4_9BURK|nr:hypothetical protein D3872_06505 [Massilia cavernae]